MFKNQKGFSLVEGLLILLLVGIVGGIGWFVYNSQLKQNTNTSQITAQNEQQVEKVETTDLETFKDGTHGVTFQYPKDWIKNESSEEQLLYLTSEAREDDETVDDRPLAKNVYFVVNVQTSTDNRAGMRYMAGDMEGQLLSPQPQVFNKVTIKSGQTVTIYKQLTAENELEASEQYFVANDTINNITLKSGKYLVLKGEFNAGESDYDVITPLKRNGDFVADERDEVKAFVALVESLEIEQ